MIGTQLLALALALVGGAACGPSDVDSGGGDDAGRGRDGGNQPGIDSGLDECFSVAKEAQPGLAAADIIIAIDTSGSMGDETTFVRQKMNGFSQQIIDSGVDVRVVMLAESQLFSVVAWHLRRAAAGLGGVPGGYEGA